MKRLILLMFTFLILMACNSPKQVAKNINFGNYDEAIAQVHNKLAKNKTKKSNQEYIVLLEEAYAKAKSRDLDNIKQWSLANNPNNLEKIYNTYLQLNKRQYLIKPLLPLRIVNENRQATFDFNDYSTHLSNSKNSLVAFLYDQAVSLSKSKNKMDIRKAYEDFVYINQLSPYFKDVSKKIDETFQMGADYVHVYTKNQTQVMIPLRLEDDLLDFSTYGLNDKWTVYHNRKNNTINYDFNIEVNFREINISPEQVREREIIQEKQIKDGMQNLLDAQGNIVKDSLGRPIKVDKFKTVSAKVYQFHQLKAVNVVAKIDYIDNQSKQLINTFPLGSEFVFQHYYATIQGDRRALDDIYLTHINNRITPFPTNEQMVFSAGEDIKNKLKQIIVNNRFRRY